MPNDEPLIYDTFPIIKPKHMFLALYERKVGSKPHNGHPKTHYRTTLSNSSSTLDLPPLPQYVMYRRLSSRKVYHIPRFR